ncbi:ATP-binding region [Carpediemonas membranifera]|uniref:Diphthine--ammonia ligase n=1 Tax=Carpediemonas membranifera TaxID=201153 RepID=A0A8J6DZK7_9EUKA|nr:ATP-binding region [Carpediemonas membranifera]|eukprot:KAG9390536.1 ATP-binding region [Carpediemonas membranifera]
MMNHTAILMLLGSLSVLDSTILILRSTYEKTRCQMKFLALISGGKDSIFAIHQLVKQGHECVALANLAPVAEDEIDSFTFQTVGHNVIDSIAKAMNLPLFRRTISRGDSKSVGLQYETTEGDEIETLSMLVADVLAAHTDIKGLSTGAVFSHYQRIRVEHVCRTHGLLSLAPLWRIAQATLLDMMEEAGMEAIIVKTASMGLDPRKHCGLSIVQARAHLNDLAQRYQVNEAGEGGEFESITLYCPGLFHQRLSVVNRRVVVTDDDDMAPVGHLAFDVALEDVQFEAIERRHAVLTGRPQLLVPPTDGDSSLATVTIHDVRGFNLFIGTGEDILTVARETLLAAHQATKDPMYNIMAVSDLGQFGPINGVYSATFTAMPPPGRCCVQMNSKDGRHTVAILPIPGASQRRLHVESVSSWAPACIGPYSQAADWETIEGNRVVGVSGQIPLEPSTMAIDTELDGRQLCDKHVAAVLEEFPATEGEVELIPFVLAGNGEGIVVDALPRGVSVEVVGLKGRPDVTEAMRMVFEEAMEVIRAEF